MRLLLLLAVACAPPGLSTTERAAVTSVLSRQSDAWNRGDLAGYMDGYARDPNLVFTAGR